MAAAVRAAMSAVSLTVSAALTSGSTNGTWSISWSEPEPQRISGARPPEDRDRRAVVEGAGDRAHAVRHARAGGQRGDGRLAGRLRVPLGRPDRRLLVADVDDLDALFLAAVVDREEVAAREREEVLDAARLECPSDQAPAVDGRGRGLLGGCHRARDPIVRERRLNAAAHPACRREDRLRVEQRDVVLVRACLRGRLDGEELDGLRDALQVVRAHLRQRDALAEGLGRRRGDEDVAVELARRRLDPRGDVHRVADDAEVEPARAADGSRDDPARVDADADRSSPASPRSLTRRQISIAARVARLAWSR